MPTHLLDRAALVRAVAELEPLPQSAVRLSGLLARADWEIRSIADVVRFDEALTGRLLGAANSVLSGARVEITSVDQAILRLGPGRCLALAVSAAVRGPYQSALSALGLEEGELWRHSVAAALAMEHANEFLARPIPANAFVTALLHDVGKLVLDRHLDAALAEELRAAHAHRRSPAQDTERDVLGVSHAEVSAWVVRAWGLPESIAEAIRTHHHPLSAPVGETRHLSYLVSLGDAVAFGAGSTCGAGFPESVLSPEVAGALGLPLARFHALREATEAELEGMLHLYGA